MKRIRLWDLPTRIFHWSLLGAVVAAFISAQIGGNAMQWHGRFGIVILGLLAFRVTWGFVGSTYARFGNFVRGPKTVLSYLKGQWHGVGHNPMGALSVLGLLAILLVQGVTGLLSNDDIAFRGPYADAVSNNLSTLITGLHKTNFLLLVLLIATHLGAIVFYTRVKKEDLVRPMVLGYKDVENEQTPGATGGGWVALAVALAVASIVMWSASGALAPKVAPPPPNAVTPAW
jgi:cytochrome b